MPYAVTSTDAGTARYHAECLTAQDAVIALRYRKTVPPAPVVTANSCRICGMISEPEYQHTTFAHLDAVAEVEDGDPDGWYPGLADTLADLADRP